MFICFVITFEKIINKIYKEMKNINHDDYFTQCQIILAILLSRPHIYMCIIILCLLWTLTYLFLNEVYNY